MLQKQRYKKSRTGAHPDYLTVRQNLPTDKSIITPPKIKKDSVFRKKRSATRDGPDPSGPKSVSSSKTEPSIPLFRLGFVAVGLGAPHQEEDQHAHDGHAQDADIGPIPAVVLGHEAQSHTRNERRSVAEQPREAVGRGGGLLRGLVRGGNADQRLRAVDAEPCGAERREQQPNRSVGRQLPEQENEQRGARHAEDAGAVRTALEPLVRRPAGEEHAEDAGNFEHRHEPSGVRHRDALRLAQQRRPPVEHREADDVDEEVGEAQNPDQRILEDVFHQERLVLGALLFGFHLPGLGSFQFGKPHRGRGVAQENHQPDGSGESDRRRNPETPLPRPDMRRGGHHALHARGIVGRNAQVGGDGSHGVGIARHVRAQRTHDVTAEDHHEARADRVRGIPHRHFRRQLRRRNPVGQQTRAGRESRTLQQPVDDPHDAHEEDHRVAELVARMLARDPVGDVLAESEREVGQRTQRQTDGHVPAGVHAVGQNAVGETRKAVDQAVQGEEDAEARLRNAEIGFQAGHGQRKILAHEVEKRISKDAHRDGTEFPVFETPYLLGGHTGIGRVRGFGLHRSIIFANGCATRSPAKRESPGANEAVRRTPRDNRFR